MQISQSETFKKEYKKISDFIKNANNEKNKNEVKKLLNDLTLHVKKMDSMHYDLVSVGKLSNDADDIRNKISDIRKKIFRIIDED